MILTQCCILLKFYIKPQPSDRVREFLKGCILLKFYIKPQQDVSRLVSSLCCILLKFYIKPQPMDDKECFRNRCILLKFYIKPQLFCWHFSSYDVVSYWNSTSNHNCQKGFAHVAYVVSYWNSTSNHNTTRPSLIRRPVVSYWNSTSNHNGCFFDLLCHRLYLIEILHQTTTADYIFVEWLMLYLIEILHQTTTLIREIVGGDGVVSYWNSTSNHNIDKYVSGAGKLYLIEILHQTTTSGLILIDKVLLTGCLPL